MSRFQRTPQFLGHRAGKAKHVKVTMNTSPDRHIKADDSYEFVRDVCGKSELYLRTWASGWHSNATVHRHPPMCRREWFGQPCRTPAPGTQFLGAAPNLQAQWERRRARTRTRIWVRPGPPFQFPHYATAHHAARATSTDTAVQLGSACVYTGATGFLGGIYVATPPSFGASLSPTMTLPLSLRREKPSNFLILGPPTLSQRGYRQHLIIVPAIVRDLFFLLICFVYFVCITARRIFQSTTFATDRKLTTLCGVVSCFRSRSTWTSVVVSALCGRLHPGIMRTLRGISGVRVHSFLLGPQVSKERFSIGWRIGQVLCRPRGLYRTMCHPGSLVCARTCG